jgi:hypothetical protein
VLGGDGAEQCLLNRLPRRCTWCVAFSRRSPAMLTFLPLRPCHPSRSFSSRMACERCFRRCERASEREALPYSQPRAHHHAGRMKCAPPENFLYMRSPTSILHPAPTAQPLAASHASRYFSTALAPPQSRRSPLSYFSALPPVETLPSVIFALPFHSRSDARRKRGDLGRQEGASRARLRCRVC